jgi:hypothetical protein
MSFASRFISRRSDADSIFITRSLSQL